MKKGLIIQVSKWKLLCQFRFYTILRVLASFFIEGGLWLSSELVGPFSIAIGYLTEFFSPGNGVASIQEFFFHYILYYELFSFVFILLLFIFLGESNREKFLSSLGFVKKELAQVSRLGDLAFSSSNGCDCPCLPGGGIGTFELNELSLEPILFILGLFHFGFSKVVLKK